MGTYFHTHTHARSGCQAWGSVRVASGLVESERVVKQVAHTPHAKKHQQLSSAYNTPAHVGFPRPPFDVCVVRVMLRVYSVRLRLRVRVRHRVRA